ncbi:MAG: alkaline phosphatase family protein [Nitrospirota bacterium]
MSLKKVLVINIVGLSTRHLERPETIPNISRLIKDGISVSIKPPVPSVTSTVQATITTGSCPRDHGIVANGFYDRERHKTSFWDQENSLIQRPRLWDVLKTKRPDLTTALLFWQHILFANSDIVVTPKPLHTDEGLVQWCYSKPVGYYEEVCKEIGLFDLMSYWGPMASISSSRWITRCAIYTMKRYSPNLLMIYLPHLDYSSQRHGVDNEEETKGLEEVDSLVGDILREIDQMPEREDISIVVLSEYSLLNVHGGISLNRILRREGLLKVREISGREYIDFEMSNAFAMVDHQIAHIYTKKGFQDKVRDILKGADGVEAVWGEREKEEALLNHERAGDLVAIAKRDRWFAYYWWEDKEKAPAFARTVDIHNKPGYDPLELFFDPATRAISQDMNLIKGSHGTPYLKKKENPVLILHGRGVKDKIRGEITEVSQVFDTIISLYD